MHVSKNMMLCLFLRSVLFSVLMLVACLVQADVAERGSSFIRPGFGGERLVFDIPPQTLHSAILLFGEQAGINVVLPIALVEGYDAGPIVGEYTISGALSLLLAKTPFQFVLRAPSRSLTLVSNRGKPDSITKANNPRARKSAAYFEEVYVVSARHREEDAHDVPISISSFDAKEMADTGIQNLIQAGQYSTNTTLKLARGTSNLLAAFIRGVGQEDTEASLDVGVGIYIDDVFINRPQGIMLDIYDAKRVEILRGPQGTLYGRNTIGGAIKYVTKRLADAPELALKLSMGSYDQEELVVSAGLPLGAQVKVGGSMASLKRGGFGTNFTTGEEAYNKDVFAFRSSVEYEPSDGFSVRVSGDKMVDKSVARSGLLITETDDIENMGNVFNSYAGLSQNHHPGNDSITEMEGGSVYLGWRPSDNIKWESISAHRSDSSQLPSDIDTTEAVISDAVVVYENKQSSQEVRMSYDGEGTHLLLGLYYLSATSISAFDNVFGLQSAVAFVYDEVRVDSWSLFTTWDYDFNTYFSGSFGFRYISEERRGEIERRFFFSPDINGLVSPYFGGDSIEIPLPIFIDENQKELWPSYEGVRNDTAFTPRVSVSWYPNNALHLYASYSTGFKGGGFDPKGFFSETEITEDFEPEKLETVELGLKSRFFDGNLRFDAVAFYSKYENMQVFTGVPIDLDGDGVSDIPLLAVLNADRATISGFELDMSVALGERWDTGFGLGLIDTEFDEYIDYFGNDIADQSDFVAAPEITAAYSIQYVTPVARGKLSLFGSINYRSEQKIFQAQGPLAEQPGYSLTNFSMTWSSSNEKWFLSLFGSNVFDKRYRTSEYDSTGLNVGATGASATVFFGNPRIITASVKYVF